MFRSTATRSLLTSFAKAPITRSSYTAASVKFRKPVSFQQLTKKRPEVFVSLGRPTTTALLYATTTDSAKKILAEKLAPHPELVSAGSSVRHVFEGGQGEKPSEDEMMAGMRSDIKTIQETFSLKEVPRDALYIGAAGVIPYAATSLSTVYLAYDINHATASGGYLFNPETAHQLLELITPIQVGYGAVIISFLGALHWGMEFAEYGGRHSYRRYMYGVAAPAVAWPTIFMPVEYALITQFLAFNFLYFADARASVRGWFPHWYSIYRFVLTFFVGASIVVSLVGRGQIVRHDHNLRNAVDYVKADRDAQWEALEREEKERLQALAAEEDEAEEGDKKDEKDEKDDKNEKGDEGKKEEKKGEKEEKGDSKHSKDK